MNLNTLKTSLAYLLSRLGRFSPLHRGSRSLADIFNYLPISENLASSGQPTAAQFRLIMAAGFTTIINLAPDNAENALPDEAGLLASLGLSYRHIPVDFKHPQESDFSAFCDAMRNSAGKVWLHCAANMRASAFLYRYRCEVLGEEPASVEADLHNIWQPFGVWAKFIAPAKPSNQQPSR